LRKNKALSWLMALMLMLTTIVGIVPLKAFAATSVNDINGHWAQSQIQNMINKGFIAGYPDNTFRPNNTITRAEFITMTNRTFSFNGTAAINYTDVNNNDWFVKEIASAKAAGYISGYPDGSMRPNNQITRQEVAAIMVKVLRLDTGAGTEALNKFIDAASIPAWSRSAVAAMVKAGYLNGYPDGTFKALDPTTRAMAAVILSNVSGPVIPPVQQKVFDKAGTYGPATGTNTITGDVTISADGVILQNTTINGNLLITEAVGAGTVTLKHITVTGTTTIKGGGVNSIKVDNCVLGIVKAEKADGQLRIILTNTMFSELIANSAVKVEGTGTINRAAIHTNGVTISLNLINKNNLTIDPNKSVVVGGETITGTPAPPGGGGAPPPATVAVTGVSLNKANLVLNPGHSEMLTAAILPANATNKDLLWKSNHPGSADVDQNGLVTAYSKGQATITVTTADGNFSKVCLVDVQVPVTGISLNKLNLNMTFPGTTATLIPIISPADAETDVVWESLDTSVATVAAGVVTPKGLGTTSIVARSVEGDYTASCTVTVGTATVPVTEVSLNYTELTLKVGNTFSLIPFVAPANATNTNVSWHSNDESVAKVDSLGRVTAIGNGTTDITVTTLSGAKTETCTVTVETPVTGVTLSKERIENVAVGDPDQALSAIVLPAAATNKTLVWSSSNTGVATFTETTPGNGTVHFVGRGSASITATTADGGRAASCDVIVGVRVTAITLNPTTATLKVGGGTLTPLIIPTPAIATNTNAEWISSNSGIASVDEDTGVITPVAPGSTVITATPVFAASGTSPTTCVVDVFNVTSVQMLKDDRLVAGKTAVSTKFSVSGPAINKNSILVTLNDGTVLQYGSDAAGVYTYTGITNTLYAGVTSATVTIRGAVSFTLNF